MASMTTKLNIGIDIESIVKLKCRNTKCMHNLHQVSQEIFCNLKYVDLDEQGKCIYFKDREEYNSKRGK